MTPLRLDVAGFVLIAACLGVIQLSIFAGQSVLFSAADPGIRAGSVRITVL